ncbi:skin secretory protein xP2-like [Schistocerca americana]|uniref:skin secretory protein xP2-like n=1 Tax=Schistocerca americana TaxID=7009 RepID=UPI001F4F56EB|nr:skin secretory protein xP2-like [Schistocerca americana]
MDQREQFKGIAVIDNITRITAGSPEQQAKMKTGTRVGYKVGAGVRDADSEGREGRGARTANAISGAPVSGARWCAALTRVRAGAASVTSRRVEGRVCVAAEAERAGGGGGGGSVASAPGDAAPPPGVGIRIHLKIPLAFPRQQHEQHGGGSEVEGESCRADEVPGGGSGVEWRPVTERSSRTVTFPAHAHAQVDAISNILVPAPQPGQLRTRRRNGRQGSFPRSAPASIRRRSVAAAAAATAAPAAGRLAVGSGRHSFIKSLSPSLSAVPNNADVSSSFGHAPRVARIAFLLDLPVKENLAHIKKNCEGSVGSWKILDENTAPPPKERSERGKSAGAAPMEEVQRKRHLCKEYKTVGCAPLFQRNFAERGRDSGPKGAEGGNPSAPTPTPGAAPSRALAKPRQSGPPVLTTVPSARRPLQTRRPAPRELQ